MSKYPWELEPQVQFTGGGPSVTPADAAMLNDRTRGENVRVQKFRDDLQQELLLRSVIPEIILENSDEVVNSIVSRIQYRIISPAGQWLISWGAIDDPVRSTVSEGQPATDPMRLYISRLMGIQYKEPAAEPILTY